MEWKLNNREASTPDSFWQEMSGAMSEVHQIYTATGGRGLERLGGILSPE